MTLVMLFQKLIQVNGKKFSFKWKVYYKTQYLLILNFQNLKKCKFKQLNSVILT